MSDGPDGRIDRSKVLCTRAPGADVGVRPLTGRLVRRIEAILGVSLAPPPAGEEPPAPPDARHQAVELLRAFSHIRDPQTRGTLLAMVQAAAAHEDEPR
ncbi:hypothetical protein OPKNFCMD_0014 [Methylobacterium crusticola]|uniref:Uncharacterized protein n=1 Tax=Methylobacterium crusticola TaxID=1697972 RepID=A0ABQ4QPT9_9HYPH|nr:hypothetical protein [Methylobacterium crusticola]GJD47308.1 hypothetical protein OPKNFCMD_0014 [Methylobacterium crusticola]